MIDNDGQWFIDPIDKTNDNYSAYTQASNGWVSTTTVSSYNNVHPTVYLKSNVKLDDGAGTLDNPYTLSL